MSELHAAPGQLIAPSAAGLILVVATTVACTAPGGQGADAVGSDGPVTVYSGRGENLIGPILDRFSAASGVAVEVRYGGTAELAATLLEEGEASPAAVFIGQDAAALGKLADAGTFRRLPDELLERVESRFRSPEGTWIGLSGRARVIVYNTDRVAPEDLPQRLEEVADERYRGRFGVAPQNASFQAHMSVYHHLAGAEGLSSLLRGIAANEPQLYENNTAIVRAVIAGEIDWGLTNHYYLWRALSEDPGSPAANYFMPSGEASSFINLAGAGILRDTPGAVALLEFLLSSEGQAYFAEETFEYPLAAGVQPAVGLIPLARLGMPDVDFGRVSAVLEDTLARLRESGLTS